MKPNQSAQPQIHKPTLSVRVCLYLLLAALAFYLISEHTAHVLQVLPFLIFLACPLMHFFMHRNHGHSHSTHDHQQEDAR